MKKGVLAVVFVVVLMAVSILPAMALDAKSLPTEKVKSLPTEEENVKISDMSPEEQARFFESQGIEIPESYSEFIATFVAFLEEDPNYPIAISNPVAFEIAMKVKKAVNSYYHRDISQKILDSDFIPPWR